MNRHPRWALVRPPVTPLVSILIPAYNAEQWIAETVRSALAQTWQPIEIIVIDDGSTDHTLQRARSFESNGVCVVAQNHSGAAAARNTAYALSHGDYIQWLDADDLLAPDKITRQIAARSGSRLLSSPWGRFLHRYERAEFISTALWSDLSPTEWLLLSMGDDLFMHPASWLVSRELTEAAGPWDTTLSLDDDGEYFCRVLLASVGTRFVPEARSYYRMSGVTRLSYIGRSETKRESLWRSMQLHIAYLRSLEDSERVRTACLRYLQDRLMHFYPERLDIVGQAEQIARDLGENLHVPQLSWKYSWIEALFGWAVAKHVQRLLPQIKWSLASTWDKALFYKLSLYPRF